MKKIPRDQQVQEFIEELYEQYKMYLLGLVHRCIHDEDACEDVFHDVFLRIIRKAELLITLPKPKLEAYMCLMVRGISIDYLRKNHYGDHIDLEDDIIFDLIEKQRLHQDRMSSVENRVGLAMMLEDMPQEDQILLLGKYYLELNTKELTDIVGGTQTAVRSKVHRARQKLLAHWRKNGLNLGDFIDG